MSNTVILAAEGVEVIKQSNPLVYLIVSGLTAALGALSFVCITLWRKIEALLKEKDNLSESKLKIALSSTEAIREAMSLLQTQISGVSSEVKDSGNSILTKLDILNKDISIIIDEVKTKK